MKKGCLVVNIRFSVTDVHGNDILSFCNFKIESESLDKVTFKNGTFTFDLTEFDPATDILSFTITADGKNGNIVYQGVGAINFSFSSGTPYKVLKIHETNNALYGWSGRAFADDDYWGLRDEASETWISRQDLFFSLQVRTSNDKYLQGDSPITISSDGQVNWNVNVSRQTTFAYKVGVTYNDFTFWSNQKLITIGLVNDYFDVSITGIVFPTAKLMSKWTSNFKYLNDGLPKNVLWSNNYYNVDSITYIADSNLETISFTRVDETKHNIRNFYLSYLDSLLTINITSSVNLQSLFVNNCPKLNNIHLPIGAPSSDLSSFEITECNSLKTIYVDRQYIDEWTNLIQEKLGPDFVAKIKGI